MIGFSTIMFSHPELEHVQPMLTKLVFVSCVVHQFVITCLSSLPFAIAQVQDAGLIFMANMVSSILAELGPTVPLEEKITTVLVHLSISTVIVGVGLILTGKARLASLVQYLPTPVIGGYLAYIGFFMVKGGISIATGISLASVRGWSVLLGSSRSLMLLSPALVGGVMLWVLTSRFHHFAVFPGCLLALPASFFLVIWISNFTMNDARSAGFLADASSEARVSQMYRLFDFEHIHWDVMFPGQLPTILSMFVMIAFASSLDIASICMGTNSNLNYNDQLQTVGTSNLVSGLTGGYTGSYIFSQTLFTSRFRPSEAAELRFPGITRVIGLCLIVCEVSIVLTPISLMAIVPKFLFGSVMIFIGIDLLNTWLIGVFHKLLFPEYLTVLGTFCCLNIFGVQIGLGAGIALAAMSFLVEYTKAQDVRIVHKTSNVIRNADQHVLLYGASSPVAGGRGTNTCQQDEIVTIELQGHIFFGSATRIQNCVKSAVYIQPSNNEHDRSSTIQNNRRISRASSDPETRSLLSANYDAEIPSYTDESQIETPATLENLHGQPCTEPGRRPTRFVVLDFSQVSGMDATAARSCFLALKLSFSRAKVCAVYCGMQPSVEFLLRANDVITGTTSPLQRESSPEEAPHGESHVTSDLDLALDWCEQQLILSAARRRSLKSGQRLISSPLSSHALELSQVFAAYLSEAHKMEANTPALLEELTQYFSLREWEAQEQIFGIGERSEMWYVLLRGTVELTTLPSETSAPLDSPKPEQVRSSSFRLLFAPAASSEENSADSMELVGRLRPGCIFGDMDFMLEQPHLMDATSTAPDVLTASLSRESLAGLRRDRPDMALLLNEILLRASYMTLAQKLHSLAI